MRKVTFFCMAAMLCLLGCQVENNPNPQTPEDRLAAVTWQADGFYANNQKIPGVAINLQVRFNKAIPFNTLNINGNTTAPATWTLDTPGTRLTLTYPSGFAGGAVSAGTQNLTVRIEGTTTLAFVNNTTEPITVFGIISIPANNELRFNASGTTVPAPVTDNNLTTGTWTGTGSTALDENAGIFNATTGDRIGNFGLTFRFRTVFGVNTLTVSGIPTPTTWELNADKTQLTLYVPTGTGITTRVLNLDTVSPTALIFSVSNDFELYGINLSADNQIRMKQQ